MACASFAKLNSLSSQWIGQQSISSRRGSSTHFAARRVSVPIRAGAYTDELIQTAVSFLLSKTYSNSQVYAFFFLSFFDSCFACPLNHLTVLFPGSCYLIVNLIESFLTKGLGFYGCCLIYQCEKHILLW